MLSRNCWSYRNEWRVSNVDLLYGVVRQHLFTEPKIHHLSLFHIVGTLSTLLNLYRDVSNVNPVYSLALDDSLQSQWSSVRRAPGQFSGILWGIFTVSRSWCRLHRLTLSISCQSTHPGIQNSQLFFIESLHLGLISVGVLIVDDFLSFTYVQREPYTCGCIFYSLE